MSKRYTGWLAWACAGLCLLFVILSIVLYLLNARGFSVPDEHKPQAMNLVMAIAFPPVGALILARRARHPIAWIFLAIGLGQGLGQFALQYGIYALENRPGVLPFGSAMYWVQEFIWFPSFCFFILLLALFPDGQPLSPRWRSLVYVVALSILIYALSMGIDAYTDRQQASFIPTVSDPYGLGDTIFDLAVWMMLLSLIPAVISLLLRLRRSKGAVRQQLKWFSFSGAVFFFIFTILSVLSAWPVLEASIIENDAYRIALGASRLLFPAAVALFPVSVGLAILRYRLYDIDLIIRRTLIYSILTVVLILIYTSGVIVMQALVFRLTGQMRSELATVFSTLAIAGLFSPVRSRIQEGIDRRFYRRKYDAEKALEAFGTSLRDEVDLETLVEKMETIVGETLQPVSISVWLRPAESRGERPLDLPAVQKSQTG